MKQLLYSFALLSFGVTLQARTEIAACGTHALRAKEEMFLHRQTLRDTPARRARLAAARRDAVTALADQGDIALIGDASGVVASRNDFDLRNESITFTPTHADASAYRFQTGPSVYSAADATNGTAIAKLGDDDAKHFPLPFSFPFFGKTYADIYVNSDGNLTFTRSDVSSSDRSLGRMVSGPPRISPLFTDLDPSSSLVGVQLLSQQDRFVVSWVRVPVYASNSSGAQQTFQATLYPDGRIVFSFQTVTAVSAVVGISPGSLQGDTSLVSFLSDPSQEYAGTIAERFTSAPEIDIVTAAQQFYKTHQDAYDCLVIFNNLDIPAASGAVAYEVTVRNSRSGYGDVPAQDGPEYGSPRRLQAVLNMGPISQYPADPTAVVPARITSRDTTMTLLGHESGHLFLAYASVRDPGNPDSRPMLGTQLAHWSFYFNSEASLLEGNRIADAGENANPRFLTTATVQGYAPLDQYLMGFRPPAEVPDTFLVRTFGSGARSPQAGVSFNGTRQNISVNDIIAAEGPRIPDSTVAQRRFRFAFLIVTPQGQLPSQTVIAQVEGYRKLFDAAYAGFSGNRAAADPTLKKAVQLSLAPASGVLQGASGAASITLDSAAAADLVFTLHTPAGRAQFPASVTIPAGKASVSFTFSGASAGVEEFSAEPSDTQYELATARIQVLGSPAGLRATVVAGDIQTVQPNGSLPAPVQVLVADANGLPYSNQTVRATPSAGGSVTPQTAITGPDGIATFQWNTGTGPVFQLAFRVDGAPNATVTAVAEGKPAFNAPGPLNAASFQPGLAVEGIASLFGTSLAAGLTLDSGQVQVLLNGQSLPLLYLSDSQINFLVPSGAATGPGTLSVVTPVGVSSSSAVTVAVAQPGIFQDGNANGAILIAGTSSTTQQQPAAAGDYLEIYATALGPLNPQDSAGLSHTTSLPAVTIGGLPAEVLFSGLTAIDGLYQVDVRVPAGVASGRQPLSLSISGQTSNVVFVQIK